MRNHITISEAEQTYTTTTQGSRRNESPVETERSEREGGMKTEDDEITFSEEIAERTTETEQAPRTLAQLLADRQAEREQQQREKEQAKEEKEAEKRANDIEKFTENIKRIMSEELRTALDIAISYDAALYPDDYRAAALLTVDPQEPHAWRVRYVWHHLWDSHYETRLVIEGPHRYRVELPHHYPPWNCNQEILDAISAYADKLPELLTLEQIEQKKQQREQERLEQIEQRQHIPIPHYRYTTGGGDSDYPLCGLLHHGAHVTVYMVPAIPNPDEQQTHYTGIVENHDENWLLLTCDGSKRQRLIPIGRIDEILPEQPVQPVPAQAQPAATTEATTTDDVPF